MARTTSAAVKAVLMGDYDSAAEPALSPFIDSASALVDRVSTCATARFVTLSSAELELVERWLAAHLYAMSDQPYAASHTERSGATYQGRTGMYLDGTKYGQTAQALDPSGCLAAVGSRRVARAAWLGKPPSTQIPYDERD